MPEIHIHHGGQKFVEYQPSTEEYSYIDLLFISKQVFDMDLKPFKLQDESGFHMKDDISIGKFFATQPYIGDHVYHLYVVEDPTGQPIQFKMPKRYSYRHNRKKNKPGINYFPQWDDDSSEDDACADETDDVMIVEPSVATNRNMIGNTRETSTDDNVFMNPMVDADDNVKVNPRVVADDNVKVNPRVVADTNESLNSRVTTDDNEFVKELVKQYRENEMMEMHKILGLPKSKRTKTAAGRVTNSGRKGNSGTTTRERGVRDEAREGVRDENREGVRDKDMDDGNACGSEVEDMDEGNACGSEVEDMDEGNACGSDSDSLDDDYVPSDEADYEFSDEEEDEIIEKFHNMDERELRYESDSEQEWQLSGEDSDQELLEYSDDEEDRNRKGKYKKRRIVDPCDKLKGETFTYKDGGGIGFTEGHLFPNVYDFRDKLR